MKNYLIIITMISNLLLATGAWMFTGRTHPELSWNTIETNNFDIHYHDEIRDIALKGASIAEQVRPILMKQMGLDTLRRLDIVFTAEDEVLNGFAVPSNHTIIWVDQNDAALWVGDEKWMRTVLAHELQHLVYFNTIKTWLPEPMNSLISGVPSWVVEGIAEYYTEKWRPFRYDISHKGHVINNTVQKIPDPHNDGFSKSLYLAERFGDSTIVKILNNRNKYKLLNFKESFKKHTGIKLKQFNEDWRRHMNTFFYGQRAQKERIEDIGKVGKLPLKKVAAFDYFSDSLRIAMIGQLSKGQGDLSLVIATRDTAKENRIRKKRQKKADKEDNVSKKVKPQWKLKEYDHGIFGEIIQTLDVSPDGKSIIYPKYRYGVNQSIMFGIWRLDLDTKKKVLLTPNMRSNYPQFSPDGESIVFVAHKNSTSQLYTMNSDGAGIEKITNNQGDTQIITPKWSPDGKKITFAQSGPDGNMDIYILILETRELKQITNSPEGDFSPIWHPDSKKISYTGLYNYTPNIYTYNLESKLTIQNTDVGDIVIGHQWDFSTSAIAAFTLNTVDSSRIVYINPNRIVKNEDLIMNKAYTSWRTKSPDYELINIDPNKNVNIKDDAPYKFYKHISHLGTVIIPDASSFLFNTGFTDGMGRHAMGLLYFTNYDTLNSIGLSYNNYTGSPFKGSWGINYYKDLLFTFQFYNSNQAPLFESFNGFSLWWKLPYNFGRSMNANHSTSIKLDVMDRQAYTIADSLLDIFDPPESGKEGKVTIDYIYKNLRAHKRNSFSPNQGYGFSLKHEIASNKLYGNFNYNQTDVDFFHNQKIGIASLYNRLRYQQISGDYLSQDQLGIFDIPNYYQAGSYVPGREYMSPRGFSGIRYGEKSFMGTLELRLPAIPLSIIEFLKILTIDYPTFALITDYGNAWDKDDENKNFIITTGAEFRFALSLAKVPLFIFSYGWAQEIDKWSWSGSSILPDPYFRMTLINPF